MNAFINSRLTTCTAMVLVLLMSMLAAVPNVDASFVPSSLSSSVNLRSQDMASVQNTLENKMVRERLATLGYSQEETTARLGQLSDGELHSLASQLDSLEAGGGALGLIVIILAIVVLSLVIFKLT